MCFWPCCCQCDPVSDTDAMTTDVTDEFEFYLLDSTSGTVTTDSGNGADVPICKATKTSESYADYIAANGYAGLTPSINVQLSGDTQDQSLIRGFMTLTAASGLTGTNLSAYTGSHINFEYYLPSTSYIEVGGRSVWALAVSGTTATLTGTVGSYVTTYTATVAGTGPSNRLLYSDMPLTLNFVSSTDTTMSNWPATLTWSAQDNTPTYIGPAYYAPNPAFFYYRWYDATTFTPDGVNQIGYRWRCDILDIEGNEYPSDCVYLAVKQGSNYGWVTGAVTYSQIGAGDDTMPMTEWRRKINLTVGEEYILDGVTISKFVTPANPLFGWNGLGTAWTLDYSNGADDITLGVAYVSSDLVSSADGVPVTNSVEFNLDNICINTNIVPL